MSTSELQFAVIKDELTAMVDKEDSNSFAPALSSKRDMLQ